MGEQAWKTCQRRIARAWGGEATWRGESGSDGRNCPVSLEVKRVKGGRILSKHVIQAQAQSKEDGLPYVLVVCDYNDRRPKAVVDHGWLLELAKAAGLL